MNTVSDFLYGVKCCLTFTWFSVKLGYSRATENIKLPYMLVNLYAN